MDRDLSSDASQRRRDRLLGDTNASSASSSLSTNTFCGLPWGSLRPTIQHQGHPPSFYGPLGLPNLAANSYISSAAGLAELQRHHQATRLEQYARVARATEPLPITNFEATLSQSYQEHLATGTPGWGDNQSSSVTRRCQHYSAAAQHPSQHDTADIVTHRVVHNAASPGESLFIENQACALLLANQARNGNLLSTALLQRVHPLPSVTSLALLAAASTLATPPQEFDALRSLQLARLLSSTTVLARDPSSASDHIAGAVRQRRDAHRCEHEGVPEQERNPVATILSSVDNVSLMATSTKSTGKSLRKPRQPRSPSKGDSLKRARWRLLYDQLVEYSRKIGDCLVPRGYLESPRLASWVAEQRKQYKLLQDGKPSSITEERIELLNRLDFAWNAQTTAWDRQLNSLKEHIEEYGHTEVNMKEERYKRLALWVKEQRRHFSLMNQGISSHMTEERAKTLDAVGFCWDSHEAAFETKLAELEGFKAIHGHCDVPSGWPRLGTWCQHQRRQYKLSKEGNPTNLSGHRIEMLDAVGFSWESGTSARRRKRESDENSDTEAENDSDLPLACSSDPNNKGADKRQKTAPEVL